MTIVRLLVFVPAGLLVHFIVPFLPIWITLAIVGGIDSMFPRFPESLAFPLLIACASALVIVGLILTFYIALVASVLIAPDPKVGAIVYAIALVSAQVWLQMGGKGLMNEFGLWSQCYFYLFLLAAADGSARAYVRPFTWRPRSVPAE